MKQIGRMTILWFSYFRYPHLWEWSWHKIKRVSEAYDLSKKADSAGPFVGGFVMHTGPASVYFHYPFQSPAQTDNREDK